MAVDDADLPVVPVVEAGGEHRHKGVEDAAADPLLLQHLAVMGGEGQQAAHVVVHHPHVQPLPGLPLQDLQDGVPHLALLDDEVFQEDVMPGLFQLLQHPLELRLPRGEVFHRGVLEGGRAGGAQDIPGLVGGVGAEAVDGLQGVEPHQVDVPEAPLQPGHLFPLVGAELVAAEQEVDQPPEHRHQQDGDDPGDLVGGIQLAADDVKHSHNADEDVEGVEIDKIFLEPQQHQQQQDELGHNGGPHHGDPLEQQADGLLKHNLPPFLTGRAQHSNLL